ncbi:ribonuclease P protein component [bacterium]|nr:ribonuclease P protein component [bacterium]
MADSGRCHDLGFKPENKLRTPKAFDGVFKEGRKKVRPSLILFYRPGITEKSRLGMAVSRKVGKAVQRNVVRRRLRELVRTHKGQFTGVWDLVIVGRPGAAELPFSALSSDLLGALRSAGILPAA